MNISDLEKKAKLLRKWILVSTVTAGSGHTTTALSGVDLGTVLFDKYFSYDIKNPKNPNNDHFILSKGHGSPLLYALLAASGAFPFEKLKTLRKFGSELEGHPKPGLPTVDVATGSLGQGLSVGCGIALSLKMENASSPKVYVLLGDGEIAEGSVWEAANFASYYKLNNLIAIVDVNRLGQSQETMFGHDIEEYVKRFLAFNFEVIAIDGHDFSEIDKAFNLAVNNTSEKPVVIIAKTKKGKGVSFLEDKDGWHGKPPKKEDLEKALKELGEVDESLRFSLRIPDIAAGPVSLHPRPTSSVDSLPAGARRGSPTLATRIATQYNVGEEVTTRETYGSVLAELGKVDQRIVSLDADVKNSTFSEKFKETHPERFIECFIAEQNMVGVGLGMSKTGKIPFVSTFACFLTRAFDQIRMARISQGNVKFVGSHAGVSIGEDGPSQMGLEDFAMFGVLPDSIIFHPSDAQSTAGVISLMVEHEGISYLRTLRGKTPVIYKGDETFEIGGSKMLRSSPDDLLTVVACGITLHEALKAYEELKKDGIVIRIVDCYSVKPIDQETLIACTRTTRENAIISVEDHFVHGGLGDFVAEAVSGTGASVTKLAVDHISRSGTPHELLDDAGISAKHIALQVKRFAE